MNADDTSMLWCWWSRSGDLCFDIVEPEAVAKDDPFSGKKAGEYKGSLDWILSRSCDEAAAFLIVWWTACGLGIWVLHVALERGEKVDEMTKWLKGAEMEEWLLNEHPCLRSDIRAAIAAKHAEIVGKERVSWIQKAFASNERSRKLVEAVRKYVAKPYYAGLLELKADLAEYEKGTP